MYCFDIRVSTSKETYLKLSIERFFFYLPFGALTPFALLMTRTRNLRIECEGAYH